MLNRTVNGLALTGFDRWSDAVGWNEGGVRRTAALIRWSMPRSMAGLDAEFHKIARQFVSLGVKHLNTAMRTEIIYGNSVPHYGTLE